jgi:hypothetical protein
MSLCGAGGNALEERMGVAYVEIMGYRNVKEQG